MWWWSLDTCTAQSKWGAARGWVVSHGQCAVPVGVQLLDASAKQISRKIEQFSPQDATWAIWSFARLFHYPDQAFLNVRRLLSLSRDTISFTM